MQIIEGGKHILFEGPPGCGKTRAANEIITASKRRAWRITGYRLQSRREAFALLAKIEEGDIVFIDEIHGIANECDDILCVALEQYAIYGAARIALPLFSCIGATTRPDRLSPQLRSRFSAIIQLGYYSPGEMFHITASAAQERNIPITQDGIEKIANLSLGVPRRAVNLLTTCATISREEINANTVEAISAIIGLDKNGLNKTEKRFLEILSDERPRSLNAIAATLGIHPNYAATIESVLIRAGFITITNKGRILTQQGKMAISE